MAESILTHLMLHFFKKFPLFNLYQKNVNSMKYIFHFKKLKLMENNNNSY